jgi:hypothetical protein
MGRRILYTKNQFNTSKEFPEKTTSSTILIPIHYMPFYQFKLKNFNNSPKEYLSFLLNRYDFLIRNGIIPRNSKIETTYQDEGLELQRVDFIPDANDWAHLKCLKTFLNRSMSWIFVYLLYLNSLEIKDILPRKLADFVVPKISNFRIVVKVILSRKKPFYGRILQCTKDKGG